MTGEELIRFGQAWERVFKAVKDMDAHTLEMIAQYTEEVAKPKPAKHDAVNHPKHYTSHPSGVECIQVVEHMGFCIGNAIKYLWRADLKNDANEDLRKAIWYIQRELKLRADEEQNGKP